MHLLQTDDKRHGKGELVDQDKSTYTGGWINDKKHGTFKIMFNEYTCPKAVIP